MKLLTGRRAVVGAVALTTAVAGGTWQAAGTHAQVSSCRTDPMVKMNNGKQLNMVATVFDSATYVSKITYTVYIPSGVAVSGETFSGGAFAGKESIVVYATNPANTYTAKYLVTDSNKSINVTGATTLVSSTGKTISSKSVTGLANSTITTQVTG